MNSNYFVLLIEFMGTIAFAAAGALAAIRKSLDIFGVILIGTTAAVGGGCIRDIILGATPPSMFLNPSYVLVAFVTSFGMFCIIKNSPQLLSSANFARFEQLINILDSLGLGAFTVIGINTAIDMGFGSYSFLLCFVGVTTGVGGGVLRDILSGVTPAILRKHVYASASAVGAVVCVFAHPLLGRDSALILGWSVITLIRLLATHFKWNLPRI